ncbi:MAG: cation-translocating P-type ATPase, partial [Chloroflexia bacterium]
ERKVSEAGYRATPLRERAALALVPFWRRERRVVTTLVGTVFALIGFVLSFTVLPSWVANSFYGVTIVLSGFGFARAGLLALRALRADMNLLMTIAVLGAVGIGDWGEAATVVLLFAFGGTLQSYTLERTRSSIRSLMDLSPTTALVRRVDKSRGLPMVQEIRLPVEDVAEGEMLIVGPGEKLPLDGVVVSGISSIDQSSITGESVPVDVVEGAEIFAGTINGSGVLQVRVTHTSGDTALARIIGLVEEAQANRAPSQQLVDRFSAVYTPIVLVGAIMLAAVPPLLFAQPFADWFYRALVLLVVACPCALVISTPVSIVAAIGAATKRGILIKGGAALEALGKTNIVAFDKTGTLTQGRPQVVGVYPLDGDADRLLLMVAAVESRSEHPLARAILHTARDAKARTASRELIAEGFASMPGMGAHAVVDGQDLFVGNVRLFREKGIALDAVLPTLDKMESEGKTAVLVGTQAGMLGVIALADTPRPEAVSAIQTLRASGIKHIAMLTGDNTRTAQAVASTLGIDTVRAELLPSEKVDAIRSLRREFGHIAMLGDGVNDAPALATADVGIAMGVAGTDAALEVADVALMSDNLSRLDYAILLSRKAVSVIRQNITISLAVKVFALLFAAFGTLPLWGAILADTGVSLLVTLNGMTLLAYRGRNAAS